MKYTESSKVTAMICRVLCAVCCVLCARVLCCYCRTRVCVAVCAVCVCVCVRACVCVCCVLNNHPALQLPSRLHRALPLPIENTAGTSSMLKYHCLNSAGSGANLQLPCTQRACIHHSTFGIKLKEKAGAGPHNMDYNPTRWPWSPRIVVKCDP